MSRVATVGDLIVKVFAVIRHDRALVTELLFSCPTRFTLAAGIHKASNANPIIDLELGYLCTDLGDDAGNFMTGDHRIHARGPLVSSIVDIRMTNTGVGDFNQDVIRADCTPCNGATFERSAWGRG